MDGVEYYGAIGFLKAGLHFADRITTVSPTYAREIQADEAGMGLDGLLRGRADALERHPQRHRYLVWDPATDPHIARAYDAPTTRAARPTRPRCNSGSVLTPRPDAFLLGVISRLSWQKGLDLLLECLPDVGRRHAARGARQR